MVVGNEGRTTVALCLRRDALRAIRIRNRGVAAGLALESHLRGSCGGVRDALFGASRAGPWLAAGPLRPGVRLRELPGVFRVGNAAGEAHPLIGEGLSMALQSSKWLVESLLEHADRSGGRHALSAAHHAYADAWRRTFMPRLRIAALYAHLVMRAPFAVPLARCLIRSPGLLTAAARLAGKARHPYMPMFREELI